MLNMPNQQYPSSWNEEMQHATSYYECFRMNEDCLYGTPQRINVVPNNYNNSYQHQDDIYMQEKLQKSNQLISNDNKVQQYSATCNVIENNPLVYQTCAKSAFNVSASCSYSYSANLETTTLENAFNNKCDQGNMENGQCIYNAQLHPDNSYNLYNEKVINQEHYEQFSNNYMNNFVYTNETNANISDTESDIIVEELTDYEEENFEQITCFTCKTLYAGTPFHLVTATNPLTVSSQVPILSKIIEIVGFLEDARYSMCNHCLGMINTIDQLQHKIETYQNELTANICKSFNLINTRMDCNHYKSCNVCKNNIRLRRMQKSSLINRKTSKFLCELCGKHFLKYNNFKRHYKVHNKRTVSNIVKKVLAFCCRICKKPFRTRTHLKEHENYCSGKLPFVCRYQDCTKKFPTSTKLKDHCKLKHEKRFTSICSICNIGFVKPSEYKSHMITHSTEKKFHCTLCNKSYKTMSNLNFHMKYHNNKLPYVCDICNKGFMRKEYLEAHVNLHKGVKNFVCQICNKTFVSQKNLDAHVKYHDGSGKKKSCDICGKYMSSGLEDHMRTHNNLKEFQCNVCKMKFNTKGALAKHKKRKHAYDEPNDIIIS